MPLLLETGIDVALHERIRGLVARAGGSVNQLMDYRGITVEDINIPDGGFGKIRSSRTMSGFRDMVAGMKRLLRQEIGYLFRGARICRDRKTLILDMHRAFGREELRERYDAAISSNLLEHSPNPIWLLLNFYFITRKGGYQFHAIPHYAYTYDRFRQPTPLEHFIADFEQQVGFGDTSHTEDYRQSAVVKDGWQREFHRTYPLTYPFIHFHVFDEHNVRVLMEFVFRDVTCDVLRDPRFSDNLVLFRNELNPDFVRRYRSLIDSYAADPPGVV